MRMKSKSPLSLRLDEDVRARLTEVSKRTGLPEAAIAQMAITAAVAATEKAGYRLVLPIEFEVKHVAQPNPQPATVYPPHRNERTVVEDRPLKKAAA